MSVRIAGSTGEALDGRTLAVVPCGADAGGITLAAGRHVIQSASGHVTGFDIDQRLIPYSFTSTYGRAFFVGLLNTLLVAAVGIVCASLLGFAIGAGREVRGAQVEGAFANQAPDGRRLGASGQGCVTVLGFRAFHHRRGQRRRILRTFVHHGSDPQGK